MDRHYCYTCMRSLCLCSELNPIDNQTHVLILQHRIEKGNHKNTAKLLNLSLKNSTLLIGDNFFEELANIEHLNDYLLVFPSNETETKSLDLQEINKLNKLKGIILIDGTWKKAKKIYYTHPQLHDLTHLTIIDKINQYNIRKSPSKSALSTFEAGYYVLESLQEAKINNIYQVFDKLNIMTLSNQSI